MLRKVLTPHGSDGAEDKEAYGGVEEEAAAGQGGEEPAKSPGPAAKSGNTSTSRFGLENREEGMGLEREL